jgi:hypothetical protein
VAGVVLLGDDDTGSASAYRLRYAVEDLTTGARTTEVVEVDTPLRSRRITGDAGSATTENGVYDRSAGRWRQVAVTAPGEVGQDLRLRASLAWASTRRLASTDGTGTVAGRRCTWWLTREPLDLAVIAPATSSDRTRSCVDDEKGLLLADTWRAGGRDLRRRTATGLTAPGHVDVFDGTEPAPLPSELVLAIATPAASADDLVVLTAPPGLRQRVVVRFGDLEPGTTTVTRQMLRVVYANERDLLVVDQVRGPTEPRGVPVQLDRLGAGFVQATGGGLVVSVQLGDEQLLRVRTSLSYPVLLRWLETVRRR